MRVAFYTLGRTGGGHFALALAMKRGLERAGLRPEFRVFYNLLPMAPPAGLDVVAVHMTRGDSLDPRRAQSSDTARHLAAFAPDLLLVDLAWRDLQYILPTLRIEAWLLLRWCPPRFFRGPHVQFNPKLYRRIIATEPIAPAFLTDRVDPIVICNRDECLSDTALRERFGIEPGVPISLIVQAGKPGECEQLVRREQRRAADRKVIAMTPFSADSIFPIAPYLPGADRIVGGAGYGLFWETRWLGLAARTELHIFRRPLDDQTPRFRAARYIPRENGADILARQIA